MVIVGNYAPTGLNYGSLVKLETLRMYDGEMTAALRTSVQNLVKNTKKLKYIEIINWGSDTIESRAFYKDTNTTLKELVGFEDVTTIGNGAFRSCTALTSPSFTNVRSIGSEAFAYCSALATVSFQNLAFAGDFAFFGCSRLTSVSFPKLVAIPQSLFYECTRLESVSLPSAVISYYKCGFYCCTNLTSVYLPNLINLAGAMFDRCDSLTSVSLPEATLVEAYAFSNCPELLSVHLPKVVNIGLSIHSSLTIPFNNCPKLSEITLSDALETVASGAFTGTSISTLNLVGNKITSDYSNGIANTCTLLKNAGFPKTVTTLKFSIGDEFINKYNKDFQKYLDEVFAIKKTDIGLFKPNVTISGIIDLGFAPIATPASTSSFEVFKTIAARPSGLTVLTSNTAPSSINNIEHLIILGNYFPTGLTLADYPNLTKLKSVHFCSTSADIRTAITTGNLLCSSHLETIKMRTFGQQSFQSPTSPTTLIKELIGFEDVDYIKGETFKDNPNLTSISFPNVTLVDSGACKNCANLTSACFPKLDRTGYSAFESCPSLKDLTLSDAFGATVGYAGANTFLNTSITTLRMVGHNTSNNQISNACSQLKSAGFTSSVHTFYFVLGDEILALSSSDLLTYINNVLNVPRTDFGLFEDDAAGYGFLDLRNLSLLPSGINSVASGKLINVILSKTMTL
jgi:hypothetical protein